MGIRFSRLHWAITAKTGKRIFLHEEYGEVLNNTVDPVKFGVKSLLEISLWKNSLILYSVAQYTIYEQYNSFLIWGGFFCQW
jgi:hypothetical protein